MKARKKKIRIRDGKDGQTADTVASPGEGEETASTGTPDQVVESAAQSNPDVASSSDPVVSAETRVTELENSLLRAKADFQNLQRRAAVERAEAVRYGNTELMRSLLGVIDDFERSLIAAQTGDNYESVIEGVRLVHANLVKALSDHGLEKIEALHERFDPNIHEALMQRPAEDHEPGTVVEQIAKGYRLRDRVVRPAKVIVAAAPQTAAANAEDESPRDSSNETDSRD